MRYNRCRLGFPSNSGIAYLYHMGALLCWRTTQMPHGRLEGQHPLKLVFGHASWKSMCAGLRDRAVIGLLFVVRGGATLAYAPFLASVAHFLDAAKPSSSTGMMVLCRCTEHERESLRRSSERLLLACSMPTSFEREMKGAGDGEIQALRVPGS